MIRREVVHLPHVRLDRDLSASLCLDDEDIISLFILLISIDLSDRSIDPPASRIVRDEHDLCSEFQREFEFCRELFLIDRPHEGSTKCSHTTRETLESLTIHTFCRRIGRRERDHHTL